MNRKAGLSIAAVAAALLSLAALVVALSLGAGETQLDEASDAEYTPPQNQAIFVVSIHRSELERNGEALASIDARTSFGVGRALTWLVLTPANLDKLRATSVRFDLWQRIVVELSPEEYKNVSSITPLHVVEYNTHVLLELTPSEFDKLLATGTEFRLEDDAAILDHNPFRFDPLVQGEPSLSTELTSDYGAWTPSLHIIQFYGPIKDEWRAKLQSKGITFIERQRGNAHLVRMKPQQAARIERLDYVRWVGPYHPAFRVPYWMLELPEDTVIEYAVVEIFNDGKKRGTIDRTIADIEELGGTVYGQRPTASSSSLIVSAEFTLPVLAVTRTAQLNDVTGMYYRPAIRPSED